MIKPITIKPRIIRNVFCILFMVFLHRYSFAQNGIVSGKISDEKGKGLPGVSVVIKGTKIGANSNIDGRYQIAAKPGSILVFTFIGFKKNEVKVENQSVVNVTLKDEVAELNEVVVVGYGTQKRTSLTGSVAQIKGDELLRAPAMNVTNVLAGRLPGVSSLQSSGRPGFDDAQLVIRGNSTTSGNNSPVVIVDGVQRTFNNLDPNEIENISILKDAAAAATYGVQGANGVILVTTKRGADRKAIISYSAEASSTSFTRFPKFLDGPDYMMWYSKAEEIDNEYLTHNSADAVPLSYSKEEIDALRNGTNTNPFLGNINWIEELTGRSSLSMHHNLSLSGGSERLRYFSTLGYLNQEGVVKNNDFRRYNLRTNIDSKVSSSLSVALDLAARKEDRNSSGIPADNGDWMNPFYQAVRMLPNLPRVNPEGVPTASRAGGGIVSPLEAIDKSGFQNYETGVLQSSLTLKYNVPYVKELEIKLLAAYDRNYQQLKGWSEPYPLVYRDRGANGWNWVKALPAGLTTTSLRRSSSVLTRQTFQPTINYSKTINDHSFKGLFVYEYSQTNSDDFGASAKDFMLTDLKELDFGTDDPAKLSKPSGSSAMSKRAGYVGRLNYDYQNRYLLELVGRYDGSMNFYGSDRQWGFFPAASLGWVVSEERFFERYKEVIDYFKLRASAGKLGNDRIRESFPFLRTFKFTPDPNIVFGSTPYSALYTSAIPNMALTWESATMYNGGFEASLLNGLFRIELDGFYKITKDILNGVQAEYPPSVGGYYVSLRNYGEVESRGLDLQISHRNKINEFNYNLRATLNYAINKVLKFTEDPSTPRRISIIGKSIGTKTGYVSEGLFQSWDEVNSWATSPAGAAAPGFIKYKDLNGDGQIKQNDDFDVIGKSNLPELVYGLNMDFQYKMFDFSALFQGAALCDIALGGSYEGSAGVKNTMDNTPFTRTFYNGGNSPYYLVEKAWTPENPNAEYPRLTAGRAGYPNHNGWANSQVVKNGAYLRLKSIQIGASLGNKAVQKLGIQRARLYIAGYNLFTLDHLKYLDPEMPNVSNGFYPQQKMYTLGINLSL